MPELDEKNLTKLQRLFDAMDNDGLTKKDVLAAFGSVVKKVLEMQKRNIQEIDTLKAAYTRVTEKLKGDHTLSVSDLRKQVDDSFIGEKVKDIINTHIQQKLNKV